MILTLETDFYNKFAKDIRETYFPNENHGTTENKHYWKTTRAIELFSNGCLTYENFVTKVAKEVKDNKENIQKTVDKYIVA
jgi:hypothetical protein